MFIVEQVVAAVGELSSTLDSQLQLIGGWLLSNLLIKLTINTRRVRSSKQLLHVCLTVCFESNRSGKCDSIMAFLRYTLPSGKLNLI